MFLTKKTGNTANKNKNKDKPKNSRALGGWDDDDDDSQQISQQKQFKNYKQTEKYQSMNILNERQLIIPSYSSNQSPLENQAQILLPPTTNNYQFDRKNSQPNNKSQNDEMFYSSEDLVNLKSISCEVKVIEDITTPGGIRIKPSESQLTQFVKQCKSLNIAIIGSLLIQKLNTEDNFQIMAKSLYAIQYLCKKNIPYSLFFKLHAQKIKQSQQPSDNVQNYMKIKKMVLKSISDVFRAENNEEKKEELDFVDPGYGKQRGVISNLLEQNNQQKAEKKQIKPKAKKLISPDMVKTKQLTGPRKISQQIHKSQSYQTNSRKQSKEESLLDLQNDDHSTGDAHIPAQKKRTQSVDLLQGNEIKQTADNITFDSLIGKYGKQKKLSYDFTL